MKYLLSIFISTACFAQPNKIESVLLENNSLYQINVNGTKIFKGAVVMSPSLVLDANGNLVVGKNPTITGSSFNNIIGGNNVTITTASSIAAFCTDCDFVFGSNYSIGGGDAHNIGGYSSTTFGYLNDNFIDGGTAIGTNIRLGTTTANNRYTRSVGIGSTLNIQNTDIYLFGIGNGQEQTEKGTYFIYGANKFGLLPDGRILINGIAYRFPTAQGQGVLTNDGFGNLSWSSTTATQTTAFKIYDTQGRLLFYQPVKN